MEASRNLASFVFRRVVSARGIARRLWGIVRNAMVTLLHDPTCAMRIHGRAMCINLSHALPIYAARFPQYDAVLSRLGDFTRQRRHRLRVVDVGANIGDSIAAFMRDGEGVFLAIEPTPKFRALLEANWGQTKTVQIVAAMCSSSDGIADVSIGEHHGTAALRKSASGVEVPVYTVDRLVRTHAFSPVDVIKIDTDGFDFDVIEGALETLRADHPAVIFECDIFGNPSYVERVGKTLSLFQRIGYRHALVYDNTGYIMDRVDINDPSCLDFLLFFQVTSPFSYFDILLLAEDDAECFFSTELDYFTSLSQGACHEAARSLAAALKAAGKVTSPRMGQRFA